MYYTKFYYTAIIMAVIHLLIDRNYNHDNGKYKHILLVLEHVITQTRHSELNIHHNEQS